MKTKQEHLWAHPKVFSSYEDFQNTPFPLLECLAFATKSSLSSRLKIFNCGPIDILDWIILCLGEHPVHCRTFSSIPDLYLLDVSSTPTPPQVVTTKMSLDIAKCSLEVKIAPGSKPLLQVIFLKSPFHPPLPV